jgi:hypothetical protein
VRNTSISKYGTDIIQGLDVFYVGYRANARAPTRLSSGLTVSSQPVASGVARRSTCDDGLMDCEGASNVRDGNERTRVPPRTQRCALAPIGKPSSN